MVNKPSRSVEMLLKRPRPLSALASLRQRHQLDAVMPGGQRELAMLQRQRVLAEDVPPPAGERPYRRVVVGRDRFEIVGRGDQLLRDVVILTALLQQHA